MRLLFWRRDKDAGSRAPPTPYDRWFFWARIAALLGAVLLLALSLGPVGFGATAPNEGGDINLTVEFYTAFEKGGGFLTWDFSPSAARILRERIDLDGSGIVTDSEVFSHMSFVEGELERSIAVVRHFEISGVRPEGQRGLSGEPVNSATPAHLHFQFSGQWAERDAGIALSGDGLASLGYAGPISAGEGVHERTILINGGLATFVGTSANARVLRIPGGTIAVVTRDYAAAAAGGAGAPDIQYERFSAVNSAVVLLAPLAIAFFVGLAGARRERDATRQPMVEPFHRALSAGFLLLLAAYLAAVPGLALWVGGVGFAVGAIFLAYRVYPADRRPDELEVGSLRAVGAPPGEWSAVEAGSDEERAAPPAMIQAVALLDKAHGPLDPKPSPQPPPPPAQATLATARAMLPKAVSPLELPDGDTPRPDGRLVPPRASSAPAPAPPPQAARSGPPASPGVPTTRVRCPGCKHSIEAQGGRPLSITCPHCGRRGVLR